MLKAIARFILRNEATPTPPRHEEHGVTQEQLQESLDAHMRDITYEWNEMYEKFEKLHLRLAKRADREQKKQLQQRGVAGNDEERYTEGEQRPSVIHLRRFGSI